MYLLNQGEAPPHHGWLEMRRETQRQIFLTLHIQKISNKGRTLRKNPSKDEDEEPPSHRGSRLHKLPFPRRGPLCTTYILANNKCLLCQQLMLCYQYHDSLPGKSPAIVEYSKAAEKADKIKHITVKGTLISKCPSQRNRVGPKQAAKADHADSISYISAKTHPTTLRTPYTSFFIPHLHHGPVVTTPDKSNWLQRIQRLAPHDVAVGPQCQLT